MQQSAQNIVCSILVFVVEEVEVPAVVGKGVGEACEFAALALGGSAEALAAVDEAGDLHDVEQVELALRGDVLHILGDELGTEAVVHEGFDAERVCDRGLAHVDDLADLQGSGGLDGVASDGHSAFLAGLRGYGAGLEDSHGPEPLVYAGFGHLSLKFRSFALGFKV